MRRVYIIGQNYQLVDAMIQTLNRHSKRAQMDLVPVIHVTQLPAKHGFHALLVEPMFDVAMRDEFEECMRVRGGQWSACEASGGFVWGELL